MTEETLADITRDAFVSAVQRGDVSAIASYFVQPHVQAEVAEIEALLEGSVDKLQIFLAHGSNVNEESLLPQWAGFDNLMNGDVAAEADAFFVGAGLLYFPISVGNTAVARLLLGYGAQARPHARESPRGNQSKVLGGSASHNRKRLCGRGRPLRERPHTTYGCPQPASVGCQRCYRGRILTKMLLGWS